MGLLRQRRIANYIIDRGLQLRYIGLVTALSALLAGALGTMVWQQEHRASQRIINTLESSDFFSPDDQKEVIDAVASRDTNLVLKMVLAGVGMVLVLSLYLVLMTHKVAGPLYKVSRYFDEMAQGRLSEVGPLRRGDQLKDFYQKFKEMHDEVRARHRREMEALGHFIATCDDAGLAGELADLVDEARTYKGRRDAMLV